MGPLRSGPRGGTGPWGQYKTPDMGGSIRAQRGRARSALFHRVLFKYVVPKKVLLPILGGNGLLQCVFSLFFLLLSAKTSNLGGSYATATSTIAATYHRHINITTVKSEGYLEFLVVDGRYGY